MSEEKMIEKAILGDEECIRLLIDQWYPIIRIFCYRCVNNWTEADDLTQEVFLKMVVNFPDYNEKGKFKSWIFKIAANTCKDYYRQKAKNHFFATKENEVSEQEMAENDFAGNVVERESLNSILNSLPYKYRECIILRYYYQFTLEEIGELLHVPKSTVNTRIRRGLLHLHNILGEDYYE